MEPGIIGSVVSALIGAGAGIGVVLIRERITRGKQVSKTRRALYAEIESADIEVAKELIDDGYAQPYYRQVDFLPTDVYDEHVGDIGLLSAHEIEAVVQFYSLAKTVRSETSALHTIAETDDYDAQTGMAAIGSLRNDLSTLITRQNRALRELQV